MNQPARTAVSLAAKDKQSEESSSKGNRLMVTEATDLEFMGARVIAAIALVLISPLLMVIALLVKMTSPGPILYRQIRVGRFGRTFQIVKFRTMVSDAEKATGAILATPGDSRITSLGRILRATHIDELPQLWNVAAGDMGFIGPRPERPIFVDSFKARIENYDDRHLVHPGITGLAQILLPYDALPEDKLRYDLSYLDARLGWRLKANIIKATAMKMVRAMLPALVRVVGGGDYRVMLERFLKEGQLALSKV